MKKYLLLILPIFFFATPAFAANTSGYAWSESVGWFDFSNATISDTTITGYAYNDNTGWLVLDGITNSSGTLSGHAWSESVGYFDFSNASISNGAFLGYAYNDNTGWISFNCLNTGTCGDVDYKVSTTWTTPSANTSGRSGGSSVSSRIRNLTEQGKIEEAQELQNRFPDARVLNTTQEQDSQVCTPYLNENIKLGASNNPSEVNKLIKFLNEKQGENLSEDGIYDQDDFEAVKRFQSKYSDAVLSIWGLDEPTGYVYKTTRLKINSFYCNTNIMCPAFTEFNKLSQNNNTPEVQKTKNLLKDLGMYNGPIDQSFDMSLHNSLISFQEEFSETMLTPWGLSEGTGYKYKTTNKFLNFLVGCDTPAIDLDGTGSLDY